MRERDRLSVRVEERREGVQVEVEEGLRLQLGEAVKVRVGMWDTVRETVTEVKDREQVTVRVRLSELVWPGEEVSVGDRVAVKVALPERVRVMGSETVALEVRVLQNVRLGVALGGDADGDRLAEMESGAEQVVAVGVPVGVPGGEAESVRERDMVEVRDEGCDAVPVVEGEPEREAEKEAANVWVWVSVAVVVWLWETVGVPVVERRDEHVAVPDAEKVRVGLPVTVLVGENVAVDDVLRVWTELRDADEDSEAVGEAESVKPAVGVFELDWLEVRVIDVWVGLKLREGVTVGEPRVKERVDTEPVTVQEREAVGDGVMEDAVGVLVPGVGVTVAVADGPRVADFVHEGVKLGDGVSDPVRVEGGEGLSVGVKEGDHRGDAVFVGVRLKVVEKVKVGTWLAVAVRVEGVSDTETVGEADPGLGDLLHVVLQDIEGVVLGVVLGVGLGDGEQEREREAENEPVLEGVEESLREGECVWVLLGVGGVGVGLGGLGVLVREPDHVAVWEAVNVKGCDTVADGVEGWDAVLVGESVGALWVLVGEELRVQESVQVGVEVGDGEEEGVGL